MFFDKDKLDRFERGIFIRDKLFKFTFTDSRLFLISLIELNSMIFFKKYLNELSDLTIGAS